MQKNLENLLRAAGDSDPRRTEQLWTEYRQGGSGAEKAFKTLLAWYGLAIYRRIWGLVRTDAAEDVFQDVLAKLHRDRRKLETFEHAQRWLRTVAVRECVDVHRRATRRKSREAKRSIRPHATSSPEHGLDLQDAIAVALSKLPARLRDAIALVYFEELDRQTAAKVLGIDRDTLASRLAEGLNRLQKLIPTPAILVAGGTIGVQMALAARAPAPSSVRLSELASGALANVATAGWSLGKLAAVATCLSLTAAATVAGWPLTGAQSPAPIVQSHAVVPNPPRVPESLQAKNLRVFATAVRPKLDAALQKLVMGEGGEVRTLEVEAIGSSVICRAEISHGPSFKGISKLRMTYDSFVRDHRFLLDLWGNGQRRLIDPKRPIVLWERGFGGKDVIFPFAGFTDALAAFEALPSDERGSTEADRYNAILSRAVEPYCGQWYVQGSRERPARIWREGAELVIGNERLDVPPARRRAGMGFRWFWLMPDGRVDGIEAFDSRVVLSADGHRLDFVDIGTWYTREAVADPR